MLKIFKTSTIEKKIKKVKRITVDTWLELTSPTNDEIDKVVEKTLVDKDLILKMLDDEERPRVEQSGNATLIVIDTPYLEKDENGSNYKTYPLGIIITENNYVITISSKRIELLNDFKKNKVKDFRTAKKTRFLIQILLRTSNYYLRALKQVYNDMEEAEQVLKKSTENRDLINLENELGENASKDKSLVKENNRLNLSNFNNNRINDTIYKQISGIRDSAFINYLLVPTICMFTLLLMCMIGWVLSLI